MQLALLFCFGVVHGRDYGNRAIAAAPAQPQ
jgi:hypothetical protein